MDENVTISREEYIMLLADRKLLTALIACGVDNWEGYEDACNLSDEDF